MNDRNPLPQPDYSGLHGEIVALLEVARRAAARSINALMTAAYWEIGRRIVEFEQGGQDRAVYGDALISRLGEDLSSRYGRGFSQPNIWRMRALYLAWPSKAISSEPLGKPLSGQILSTPSRESADGGMVSTASGLSTGLTRLALAFPMPWSAYVRLLSVKNPQARSFYETEALRGGWSVRQLDRQIGSQFYERTALSRDKAAMLDRGSETRTDDLVTPLHSGRRVRGSARAKVRPAPRATAAGRYCCRSG